MMFLGVALVIAVGLAFLVSADAGSLVGLSEAQTGQLLPLVLLALVFAGGIFVRRQKFSDLIGSAMLWVGLLGVGVLAYTYRHDLAGIAGRVVGELRPGVAIVEGDVGTASFRRGLEGHFAVNATINDTELPLIFDTGASAVVLTSEDARKAGFDTSALDYSVEVATANGTGRAAVVTLDSVVVGGIARGPLRAFVVEDGALDTSLLGMNFLETLRRYSVERDRLELVD
jgi:aspartyl protease family protein